MNDLKVDLEDPRQVTLLRLCERKHQLNRALAKAEAENEWDLWSYFAAGLAACQARIDSLTEQLLEDPA